MQNIQEFSDEVEGVKYNLKITLKDENILIEMKSHLEKEKDFNILYSNQTLPDLLKKIFINTENLFDFFSKKQQFEVDPLKG